jgi:hypothetical protein
MFQQRLYGGAIPAPMPPQMQPAATRLDDVAADDASTSLDSRRIWPFRRARGRNHFAHQNVAEQRLRVVLSRSSSSSSSAAAELAQMMDDA